MPASSQASSELSTASLMVVRSAFEGLSKPSRCRFLTKNSETEISRCFWASVSAVTRGAALDAGGGFAGGRVAGGGLSGADAAFARPGFAGAGFSTGRDGGSGAAAGSPKRSSCERPPLRPGFARSFFFADCAFAKPSPSLCALDKRGSVASHAGRPQRVRPDATTAPGATTMGS